MKSLPTRFWTLQRRGAPYLFVAPFVLLFLAFFLYPMTQSFVLSLRQSVGPRESKFVGLHNYAFMLTDLLFWSAVAHTLVFAALYLTLQVPLSLGLALLLNHPRVRFRRFFRFAFFSSYLVGSVFVAIIFSLLLAPRTGLVNRMLQAVFGAGAELNWKSNAMLAMPAIVLAALWLSVGQAMIYFLAALQSVDRELYEAAAVDGAGGWRRFLHITLPGIRPVLVYLVLVGTIYSLQLFELPYIFFQQRYGPGGVGMMVVSYLYMHGFAFRDLGYASAVGWVLVVLISIVAYVQLKVTGALKEL